MDMNDVIVAMGIPCDWCFQPVPCIPLPWVSSCDISGLMFTIAHDMIYNLMY